MPAVRAAVRSRPLGAPVPGCHPEVALLLIRAELRALAGCRTGCACASDADLRRSRRAVHLRIGHSPLLLRGASTQHIQCGADAHAKPDRQRPATLHRCTVSAAVVATFTAQPARDAERVVGRKRSAHQHLRRAARGVVHEVRVERIDSRCARCRAVVDRRCSGKGLHPNQRIDYSTPNPRLLSTGCGHAGRAHLVCDCSARNCSL